MNLINGKYYRLSSERALEKSIAQYLNNKWYLIGEAHPVSLNEINRRGWELDSIVEDMEI